MYKLLYRHTFLFSLSIYLGVELLCHMATLYLFEELSKVVTPFYILIDSVQAFLISSYPYQSLLLSVFLWGRVAVGSVYNAILCVCFSFAFIVSICSFRGLILYIKGSRM